jgi:hypothetical protein
VYRLLLDFYLKKVYPPRQLDQSGVPDLTVMQYSPEHAVLAQARTRLAQIVGDAEEQKQFRTQYATLTGKDLAQELSYDEYRSVLSPYCKTAGKFASRTEDAVVHTAIAWRDIFALDITKIDKSAAREQVAPPPPRPAVPVALVEKQFGDRPCPSCTKPIDRRAVYCTHCKKTVATLVACPHCQESRVPDDLDLCWKCGQRMREDEPVDCPQCFTWSGYVDQYPCANCGYDPKLGPVMQAAEGPILTVADHDEAPSEATVAEPAPVPAVALVQCSICYSNVEPQGRCSVCESPLEVA